MKKFLLWIRDWTVAVCTFWAFSALLWWTVTTCLDAAVYELNNWERHSYNSLPTAAMQRKAWDKYCDGVVTGEHPDYLDEAYDHCAQNVYEYGE